MRLIEVAWQALAEGDHKRVLTLAHVANWLREKAETPKYEVKLVPARVSSSRLNLPLRIQMEDSKNEFELHLKEVELGLAQVGEDGPVLAEFSKSREYEIPMVFYKKEKPK